jgi:hypothetical protein
MLSFGTIPLRIPFLFEGVEPAVEAIDVLCIFGTPALTSRLVCYSTLAQLRNRDLRFRLDG